MAIYRITYNNIVPKCRKCHFRRFNFYYFFPEELDFNSLNSLPKFYLQWLECLLLYYFTLSNQGQGKISSGVQAAPYFIILLCLMPDDFTCQGESAGAQSRIALYSIILLCLMPGDFTRQGDSTGA